MYCPISYRPLLAKPVSNQSLAALLSWINVHAFSRRQSPQPRASLTTTEQPEFLPVPFRTGIERHHHPRRAQPFQTTIARFLSIFCAAAPRHDVKGRFAAAERLPAPTTNLRQIAEGTRSFPARTVSLDQRGR
jgi:hypothetical protein